MTDAVVAITDNARAVLALSEELQAVSARCAEERAKHAKAIVDESGRHDRAMQALLVQRSALEQAILKLGASSCT